MILPRDLCPVPVADLSFEEAEQYLTQEAEKRKKEWQNQMEKLRIQLQNSKIRTPELCRRSVECNLNIRDRMTFDSDTSRLNHHHQFRDSFNHRLANARRGLARDVITEDQREYRNSTSPVNHGFSMKLDMSEYRPEHITVQAKGHTLFIQASCEELKNDSRTLKEYSKRVEIPHDVDIDLLISRYSCKGVLTIEVPMCPHPSPVGSRDNMRQV